jgi:hypothetical protein
MNLNDPKDLAQLLEAFGVGLNILFVIEVFFRDDMHHRVQQCHVASRFELQEMTGVARER